MPYFSLLLLCILSYLKILREHIKTNVKTLEKEQTYKNKNSSYVNKLNIFK